MKTPLISGLLTLFLLSVISAQEVTYEEYDLDNGLHVILHQDNNAPVVTTSVMYHVGAKDENPEKTGFAHFFEHLLFEGTQNIERGEWFKIVSSNGGRNNANTTQDRTYYYEVFPSNNLELGLWMESERMMHPIINKIGVDTQSEVVQEERRMRYDNSPYGRWREQMFIHLFKKHPYRWQTIGSLEHLANASLEDFKLFNKKYYVPNNAVLVVAGDIDREKTKKMIEDYYGPIPKGEEIQRQTFVEDPITSTIKAEYHDPNIQIPAILLGYRTPAQTNRDAYVLDMISTYLSDGKSSKLYKKLVDDEKKALQVFAFNGSQEDYGAYVVGALPVGETSLEDLKSEIDGEIEKIKTELISEKDYQKLQNKFENQFVNSNSSITGIANSLARNYMLYDDTSLINNEIDIYRSITREEIMEVSKKYLNTNQRVELNYLPEEATAN
ncbi:M16 family metallopeptidase [Maribacter luteus]|uniref:Insulinase family protein n=1 Tax=Maribacter luteus TaxID=2594478 RepID=A0A6I2MK08_9FLAO|nr:pitrilysin family protein [Maribacter luteus]MRX62909.1 insulinase family protein [Maribacter luteus]|tara:strand:+ start:2104 stop:3426 length:1323 start_codon:yes stop_codon:yes gene_type:complete